jgi:uncharacterized protein YgbK (DUF1537 family)
MPEGTDLSERTAVAVIADDLTGANDTGAQFAKRGIATVVLLDWNVATLPLGCEVLVVNTESRHISRAEAAHRVSHVARIARSAGVKFFFKKTDSTLRGNIGAELEALMQALDLERITFVPAFPELGRATRDGIHYVHDKPIAESAFARDPLNPVTDSRVASVLKIQGARNVESLPSAKMMERSAGICVIDCESAVQLSGIAEDVLRAGDFAAAGSAAFADQFCRHLGLHGASRKSPTPRGPILLVNGSLHERALEQITAAPEIFLRIRMPPEVLIAPSQSNWDALMMPEIEGVKHVLLHSILEPSGLKEYLHCAAEKGLDEQTLHLRVAERTGELVSHLLRQNAFGTLIVFGGDTLTGIARACGWSGFVPLGEAGAGITVARPIESETIVISKAGGFGDGDAVERILAFIEEISQRR